MGDRRFGPPTFRAPREKAASMFATNRKYYSFSLQWLALQMRGGQQSLATPIQKGENSGDG